MFIRSENKKCCIFTLQYNTHNDEEDAIYDYLFVSDVIRASATENTTPIAG